MPHNTFDTKHITLFAESKTNGATSSASFDTRGFGEVSIRLSSTTTHAPSVLKVEQSDDNSTWVSAGLTGGTDFTIGASSGTTEALAVLDVNLVGKQRYLKLTVSPTATQILTAHASLGRAGQTPAQGAASSAVA